ATIIEDCYQRARQLLAEHADQLRAVVAELLVREALSGEEVRAIMRGEQLPAEPEPPAPTPQEEVEGAPTPEAKTTPPVTGEQPQPA
ncbi:MAG: cell division protein FtsH, partial [Armatimonadetes bacterium]|nr:cell division protein FtsH [Armatimonadota bacterium]